KHLRFTTSPSAAPPIAQLITLNTFGSVPYTPKEVAICQFITAKPNCMATTRDVIAMIYGGNRLCRRRLVVTLWTRPEGATRDEVFAATGWAAGSLSMVRFARENGVVLRRTRLENGAYRYYGRKRLPKNARIIVGGMLNTLKWKLDRNRDPLILRKSGRRGP